VGGTGKTPMALYVTKRIKELGYKVTIISRGYKGGAEKKGGIVSDGRDLLVGSRDAGDEPFMIASKLRDIPVIVGRNRFKAGMRAVKKFAPDVVVLDDAFQHLKLWRDIDLVLLDYRRPFGNMRLLPRGVLREPISALLRADALILTRYDIDYPIEKTPSLAALKPYQETKPVFRASHVPYIHQVIKGEDSSVENNTRGFLTQDSKFLKGRNVFAFSGLADNSDFYRTIKTFECFVSGHLEFPDHHHYTGMDFNHILRSAIDIDAEYIVTTEKDYVRIGMKRKWPLDLVVLGVEISFGNDETIFDDFIKKHLAKVKISKNIKR
jgi:tetraacyldisaccharide 4'-kinase